MAEIPFLDGAGATRYRKSDETGLVSGTPAALHNIIDDPCAGTQTNDVKVTLDSEAVVLGAGTAEIGKLAAGTAAIGKLAANSGVDIGDVDVTSVIPGTGATNLGKAADSAAGATDTGVPPLAVVDAALTAITPIDGDYAPVRVDANGSLWVTPSGTVTVDGSGVTQPVSGTVTANLSATDNGVLDNIDTNTTGLAGCVGGTELQVDVVGALPAGTNAIGKLAANSGVDIGDVDVTSQPARDRLTDNVGVALQTDVILSDTTALTPKFKSLSVSGSGDNTIQTALTNKIRVLSYTIVNSGASDVNVYFRDGTAGTALTGAMTLSSGGGGGSVTFSPVGHFETSAATLLAINLSAAVQVSGHFTYVEVA